MQIVGKKVGVIHVADNCNNLSEQEKPSSSIPSTDAAIPSSPTSRLQVQAAEQPCQLEVIQFYALLVVRYVR